MQVPSFLSSWLGDAKTIAAASGEKASSLYGRATTARKKSTSKTSLWGNIFGVAQAAGLKMPMDTEINSLRIKKSELSSLKYKMKSISHQVADALLKNRANVISFSAGTALTKAASQAAAQAVAATRLIDAAISDGVSAQEKMRYGTGVLRPSAAFFSKKAIADQTYSLAKNRLNLIIASAETNQRQHFGFDSLPSGILKAGKDTVVEFGGKVSRGMVKVGETVETAAESFGTGASAIAPYMKYAPYVLGGFAVLYGLQFLPRARKD